jgi:hypothetical protein
MYVCIGADVPAYYETSNNLLSFPTHISPSKSLGLNLRPTNLGLGWVLFWSHLGLVCETGKRPKRDLFETQTRPICD